MLRREVLMGLMAMAGAPAMAGSVQPTGMTLGPSQPFAGGDVRRIAQRLAAKPYVPPMEVPEAWTSIDYDDYRKIRFDIANALWNGEPDTPLRLDVFPPGLYFPKPVKLNIIEDGGTRPITFDLGIFQNLDELPQLENHPALGFSGFRFRAELEKPTIYTEFAVFQGASYFRALGTGMTYGLSARGLAIDTAAPSGEEFPDFTAFWIEKPGKGQSDFVVHALLDSPSCTGAYRFVISPGNALEMQVEAEVFARKRVRNFGIAPLTSMFKFDETNRDRFSDFRPAVHDNDGLLIANGAGETIWRPLANPRTLQISAFNDRDPKGFGLMQRARDLRDFADLEAHYHNRPGLWIEPGEGWGPGNVTLIEIPTDREIYDNIVAYWRPDQPLEAGLSKKFSYRMIWGAGSDYGTGLKVLNTRMGRRFEGGFIITVDFEGSPDLPDDLNGIMRLIRSSAGEVSEGILQHNPETGGVRLGFTFRPGDASLAEFRVQLRKDGNPLSEVWLYRWTA